ncbi:hypothetical protein [Sphingomonas xanthus]|uniref:Uncharacterized protein n=1 Tax=Sphingomonas xanthus TaxID=2594473 RepID=A0A516ISY1_9SPHN|nr:hypothetical protein [Sphingomonas xanthus]QDP20032.1 hypothetical protein FMM02_08730 [Sphingomonas xanthus]
MIFKRSIARLRAQNWAAITIELLIVVVGVFIGTMVANWNQDRLERRDAAKMLRELRPALTDFVDFFETAKIYYATTRDYSEAAFGGWQGDPAVSDEQFVIGAYQASQIYSLGLNAVNWTQIFGGNQLQHVDEPELKKSLANLMTLNFELIDTPAVDTDYRRNVRQVIPEDIQDAIRAECGDRVIPGKPLTQALPRRCDLDFPDARWSTAAARLRSRPQLTEQLRWHRAAVAAFLSNMELFEQQTHTVIDQLDDDPR